MSFRLIPLLEDKTSLRGIAAVFGLYIAPANAGGMGVRAVSKYFSGGRAWQQHPQWPCSHGNFYTDLRRVTA